VNEFQKQSFLDVKDKSTLLYWQILVMLISSAGVKWGASTACLLVFLWVQNGDTMPHHLPQSAAELHCAQYGTTANVPATLIYDAV
jgi:hypothetical protein